MKTDITPTTVESNNKKIGINSEKQFVIVNGNTYKLEPNDYNIVKDLVKVPDSITIQFKGRIVYEKA
jgi:hypothetical protein